MMRMIRLWMMALLFFPLASARADKPGDPQHQRFDEGDLALEGGGTIRDFSLSYVTHGKLNEQKSNAILDFINKTAATFLAENHL